MIAVCRDRRSAAEIVTCGSGSTMIAVFIGGPPDGVTEAVYSPGRTPGPTPPRPPPTVLQLATWGRPFSGTAGAIRRSQQVRFKPASDGPRSVRMGLPVESETVIRTPPVE